nr:T9SS type A sorting domain-containing protein [uncultured Flavobacterium sp.]
MKKIYFLVLALSLFNALNAQIVNIPDPQFKKLLLSASYRLPIARDWNGNRTSVDTNDDGEIQESEAYRIGEIDVSCVDASCVKISSLEGISKFTRLQRLRCSNNQITTLDLSDLTNLYNLYCDNNKLTSLNLNGLKNMYSVDCSNNELVTLDVSTSPLLQGLDCSNNYELVSLFMKNGTKEILYPESFYETPKLQYICADEFEFKYVQDLLNYNAPHNKFQINSYCSFTPGGKFYTLEGASKFDEKADGCDISDSVYPNLNFSITDGTLKTNIVSNTFGDYSIAVTSGTHTITPILEKPSYFSISPISKTISFSSQTSPVVQDFCIAAKGIHNDLEILIIPIERARPGFNVRYKIIYKNKGTQTQSGSVKLTFNDAVLDLIAVNPLATTQTTNNLSWNFPNLRPFEIREITFTLKVNSPMETPAVNDGYLLVYNAAIIGSLTDETPKDNSVVLNQTVVNSFDPNDKTCLEGAIITPTLIGEYVHYMIRFENTGTYQAENIVVKDIIDLSKFDISTLIPTSSSHSFITKISEGNKVEFIFENINLPFDDANNDGYVAFKIKTKSNLRVGDSFTNEANIYFDYNFPILTNKATSKFQNTLGTSDFEFSNYFTLYPNPASDLLNIGTTQNIEIKALEIYDILGQVVIAIPNAQKVSNIDVSKLKTGNYFIKVKSDKGSSSMKFIKK